MNRNEDNRTSSVRKYNKSISKVERLNTEPAVYSAIARVQFCASRGELEEAIQLCQNIINVLDDFPQIEPWIKYSVEKDYSRYLIALEMNNEAIEQLFHIRRKYGNLIAEKEEENYSTMLILCSLLSICNRFDESIKWHKRCIEFVEGSINTANISSNLYDMSISEDISKKLASLYLGLGKGYFETRQYKSAKEAFEMGYMISFRAFGEKSEETLKLDYNLSVNEMLGLDYNEGYRQLKYVVELMVSALGKDHPLTQKAIWAQTTFSNE